MSIYVNKKNLASTDENILQSIKFDLIDLDTETKALNSYFAEWSLLWLDAIISLRIKMKSDKNANDHINFYGD